MATILPASDPLAIRLEANRFFLAQTSIKCIW
jgi:hypothetical protein